MLNTNKWSYWKLRSWFWKIDVYWLVFDCFKIVSMQFRNQVFSFEMLDWENGLIGVVFISVAVTWTIATVSLIAVAWCVTWSVTWSVQWTVSTVAMSVTLKTYLRIVKIKETNVPVIIELKFGFYWEGFSNLRIRSLRNRHNLRNRSIFSI